MSGFQTSAQKAQAKRLRRNMTPAERVLWSHLRAHRFKGLSVRRQAPVGPYIADFLIPEHRLIIEADGAGHGSPAMRGSRRKASASFACGTGMS